MNLSIAIPDSCLVDEATNLDKSRKIAIIARACAIFKVKTIFIYELQGSKNDRSLLVTILKYLETPPFLRKKLFSKINELKFAGVLHPLKIPSHTTPPNPKKVKDGDVREGVVLHLKGKKFVDIGINQLIPYFGHVEQGKRVTIQFRKGFPELISKEITKNDITEYWGYVVKERSSLFSFLSTWKGKIVLTSRKGKPISVPALKEISDEKQDVLLVFGSTEKGVFEILGNQISKVQNSKILNFFPNQATETIRMEEAILGTLSILNSLNFKSVQN